MLWLWLFLGAVLTLNLSLLLQTKVAHQLNLIKTQQHLSFCLLLLLSCCCKWLINMQALLPLPGQLCTQWHISSPPCPCHFPHAVSPLSSLPAALTKCLAPQFQPLICAWKSASANSTPCWTYAPFFYDIMQCDRGSSLTHLFLWLTPFSPNCE